MDTVAFEQHFDVVGHSFLETIDLDIMEQTIIDTVVAEISSSEHTVMFEPALTRSYSEPVLKSVIEAVDVEGLLEQFEEASQNMEGRKDDQEMVVKNEIPVFTLYTETDLEETLAPKKDRNGNIEKKELTKEVIQKLKTCTKSKSAVMLPMMVPAKRGRGRAMTRGHPVALPAGCTPLRLQRVMMQHEHLKGSIAVGDTIMTEVTDPVNSVEVNVTCNLTEAHGRGSSSCVTRSDSQLSDLNSYEHILDHDYSKNIEKVDLSVNCDNTDYSKNIEKADLAVNCDNTDYSKNIEKADLSVNCDNSEKVSPADIEEGEIIEKEETVDSGRSFRGSKSREDLMEDHGNLFDKIPSYYTALSIPRKQFRKTASCVTGRGGMTVHDYIERDSSPIRDTSMYSKLPDYCSSFTNSTRYDSMTEYQSKKYNEDRDSKVSSGYSSENHSPDLSVRPDRSRSRSSSCSRSRSQSAHGLPRRYRKSSCSTCSGYLSSGSSCSGSVCSNSSCCRSRSNSCESARSISCSTCRSRSSSAASRSMSRSASRSVSRSPSRSVSRSPSRSVSRSPSRSMSRSPERWRSKDRSRSRSSVRSESSSDERSHDRSWKRERYLRGERTRRHSRQQSSIRTLPKASHRARSRRRLSRSPRSGSYSSSRSRSRGYRSRSRSDSRDRKYARSESLERRREERRKLRDEEKEQQMKERRIVYVGGLPRNYTKHKLRDNFTRFGPIEAVQLHFREHGDNYGFVTFTYTCDAFAAIEKGNKIPALENFDLCFGGRRQFCDVEYADLDGNKEVEEEYESKPQRRNALDFDELLRMAKAGLKKS